VFVELMPLLAGRTVLITVAKVDDKTLRVNVIPALAKADDNPALTTPLTYTGPPEELDAELGKHLAGYVQTHQQTASTLAEARATMEAAAKAAQEEAKRKAEERKKATQKPPDKGAAAMAAEPAEGMAVLQDLRLAPQWTVEACASFLSSLIGCLDCADCSFPIFFLTVTRRAGACPGQGRLKGRTIDLAETPTSRLAGSALHRLAATREAHGNESLS